MNPTILKIKDGSSLCITIQNNRTVSISPLNIGYEIRDSNNKLIGLNCGGDLVIKIGEVFRIDKKAFKILFIEKEESIDKGGPAYLLKTHKSITKTSMYIMPFLGFDRSYFRWQQEFVNAFIGTEKDNDYGSFIYLVYRFNGSIGYADLESKLENHPCYLGHGDPDKYHVIFKFDLPKEYLEDINKILKGKYSTITPKSKEKILYFHSSNKERPLGQILYKSEKRREELEKKLRHAVPKGQELLDIFYVGEEIYKNNYIIQDENE